MLIAHLADVHLGFRQYGRKEREEDIFRAFEYVIEEILKERPDVIIIAGDLFHTPIPSDLNVLIKTEKILEKVKERGIPVIGVAGDHDLPRRKGVLGALDYLSQRNYIFLFKASTNMMKKEERGVKFGGFSAIPSGNKERIRRYLKLVEDVDVLILHQAVREAFPLDWHLELKDIPDKAKYVALGHIHKPITLRKGSTLLLYPGSLEILSINEIVDRDLKSAVLVDLSSDEPQIVGRIKPPIRRQELIILSDDDYKRKLKEILSSLVEEGAIIHVKIKSKKPRVLAAEAREILKKLKPLMIRISFEQIGEEVTETMGSFTPEDALREVLKGIVKESLMDDVIGLIRELGEGNEDEALEISKEIFKKL